MTERLRAGESSARDRQAFLAGLVEGMSDAVLVTDTALCVTEYTGDAEHIYGWSRDEVLGKHLGSDFLTEFPHGDGERFRERLDAREAARACVRARRKDGSWADLDLLATPLRDAQGEFAGWLSVARDISEQEDASRALRSVVVAMAEGMILLDANGKIVECNAAAERILGLTRAQLEGRTSVDPRWRTIHEDGSPFPGDSHPAVVAQQTGEPVSHVVMGVHTPEGTLRWILVNAEPVHERAVASTYAVVTTFTDITEEIQTTQELAEARRQLGHVLDGSNDGAWDWHLPSGRVHFSERWAAILGYRVADLPPLVGAWEALVHPEDRDTVMAHLGAHLRGHTPHYECEHRLRHRDGHWVWVLDRGKVVERGADGVAIRAAGTHTDVSDRKAAEVAVREREGRLRAFFDSPAVGIIVSKPDAVAEEVNDRACEILGYDREELLSCTWRSLTHPHDLDADARAFDRMRAGDIENYSLDKRFIRKDGGIVWCQVSVSCVRRAEGGIEHAVAIITDISERKAAEERLRESEARLRVVVESVSDAINLLDLRSGEYVLMNPRQVELTGFSREETQNLPLSETLDRVHPDDREVTEDRLRRVVAGEPSPGPVQYRWRVKSGEYRWFHDARTVVRDEAGQPVALVGVIHDVTERTRTEEAIRETLAGNASLVQELRERLETKVLSRYLSICMYLQEDPGRRGSVGEAGRLHLRSHRDAVQPWSLSRLHAEVPQRGARTARRRG